MHRAIGRTLAEMFADGGRRRRRARPRRAIRPQRRSANPEAAPPQKRHVHRRLRRERKRSEGKERPRRPSNIILAS